MIKKIILFIIFIINFNFNLKIFGQEQIIGKIEFHDNVDIPEDILTSVIDIKSGDEFTQSKLEKAIQNLKNTTIFNPVTAETTKDPKQPNIINITFQMKKKWTIIPYIIAGSGGGTSYYAFGVFDTNFLDRLYIVNFNYRIENNDPNYSIGFTNKYTFGLPLITGINAYINNKKDTYYTSSNQINGFVSYQASAINPYAVWQFHDYFLLGGGILFQNFHSINQNLTESEVSTNQQNNIENPKQYSSTAIQARLTLGKINYDDLTENGIILNSVSNTTIESLSDENYSEISNTILGFYAIKNLKNSYLGLRIGNNITNSNNATRQNFIGGLDKIRGFNYSQFNGKIAFYSNYEFRYTMWEGNYIALQLVPFIDIANVADTLNQVFSQQSASSYGFGIRAPLTKINKIAFRLDFAKTFSPFKMNGVSFGLMQFF